MSADKKLDVIRLVESSYLPRTKSLARLGLSPSTYYRWSKAFLEAGKNGLTLDTRRDASKEEVKQLKQENDYLKKALAEAVIDVQKYKKSLGM